MNNPYDIIREDLHRKFDHSCGEATVDRTLDYTLDEHAGARITDFLPVLVEKTATEQLEAIASKAGYDKPRPEILFVCQRGTGRSQLAAAMARHMVDNDVFTRATGLEQHHTINPHVLTVLEERGIPHDYLFKKTITPRVNHTADVLVLMGVDETPPIPATRTERWNIEDPEGLDLEDVRYIANDIHLHLVKLLKEMGVR